MNRTMGEIETEILETKREMKRLGIRKISCFNGGLNREEMRFNTELFRLKTELQMAKAKGDA